MKLRFHSALSTRRWRRGVTFFEITVVFIVIAILAAVAFFGTRRLMVDTQVTRAREDQRVISRALQNYFVDYYDFPTQGQGLVVLSEPVTYLASIPQDIFSKRGEEQPTYLYRTFNAQGLTGWLLVSRGPDADVDFDQRNPLGTTSSNNPTPGSGQTVSPPRPLPEALMLLSYDPTNGLRSDGDIYTLAPIPLN